jgi:hypothetical protein
MTKDNGEFGQDARRYLRQPVGKMRDDWSPEAREAAAEARKKGSSGEEKKLTKGVLSKKIESLSAKQSALMKKFPPEWEHVKISEIMKKDHPLAKEYAAHSSELYKLRSQMEYFTGPGPTQRY